MQIGFINTGKKASRFPPEQALAHLRIDYTEYLRYKNTGYLYKELQWGGVKFSKGEAINPYTAY